MSSAYDYSFRSIDGKLLPLSDFKDHAVLVVNTASRCGLTPQYKGLEALYTEFKDAGLVVLGVPSNQFGGQEPGTEADIKSFCETEFNVDFPLTGKTDVKGPTAHPFYQWAKETLGDGAEPSWNFHKILVGRDGSLVRAFGSRTEPSDPELRKSIEAAI